MEKSLQILIRELAFIESRILLIRQGKVNESKGISLKEALEYQSDIKEAIKLLEANKK